MKPVLSREQMRAFDRHAIESCHVPGLILMENAGRGAADTIERIVPTSMGGQRSVVFVCGSGNNGGDGFVTARHLLCRGWRVQVFLIGETEQVTGEARINLDAFIDLGGALVAQSASEDLHELMSAMAHCQVIVDAIFGTGLSRSIEAPLAHVVHAINAAAARKVALDIPSGLDADTGAALGAAVVADDTVTFAHLKTGLLTPDGARLAGTVHLVDIGVPGSLVHFTGHVAEVLDEAQVTRWLPSRWADIYKHAAGAVLVIAGSPGKTGAAALVARGALRCGAGLCTVATWASSVSAIERHLPELMVQPLDMTSPLPGVDTALRQARVVAIGPGFGLDGAARSVVEHVVLGWNGVKVVDADAITHFSARPEALRAAVGTLILTPHSGEMARLLGRPPEEIQRDRFGAIREAVERTGAIVVLKGARTLVGGPKGLFVNTTGNPALATAGSGDVLTGIVAALACGCEPQAAAAAGVFLHGRVADEWVGRHGADRGMLASEIADLTPDVLAVLRRQMARV